MEMPGDTPNVTFPIANYWNGSIQALVANGSISTSKIDDMLRRVLTPYFFLGQDRNYPSIDPSGSDLQGLYPQVYRYDFNLTGARDRDPRDGHAKNIRALGAQASVLLKNVNNALPLKAPKNIGVFGNDAGDFENGMTSFQRTDFGTLPIGGGSGALIILLVYKPGVR